MKLLSLSNRRAGERGTGTIEYGIIAAAVLAIGALGNPTLGWYAEGHLMQARFALNWGMQHAVGGSEGTNEWYGFNDPCLHPSENPAHVSPVDCGGGAPTWSGYE